MTHRRQRGFIHIPDSFFVIVGILMAIGAITLLAGVPYGIWWLIDNFDIVRTR